MIKILDFGADWCPSCKVLKPVVEEFASENDNVEVEFINVDQDAASAAKYKVRSLPTLIFLSEDEEVHRSLGAKTKSELAEIVSSI